jgi:glycosyltransferase involved in cell wall biosynthesis
MKLIVQIPCLNEQDTIAKVIKQIPKQIDGIDQIEILIIDDGSNDSTVEIAHSLQVDHIIQNIGNKGLGISFQKGMQYALDQGADILVNTDGDDQYPGHYIPELVKPIINNQADIVIGDRQTNQVKHFSRLKRLFQWIGTRTVILLSGEKKLKDAVSGFRAYSREAMLEINITEKFSYTLDATIQASDKRLKLESIPFTINPPTRPSRLFKNMWVHIRKSGFGALRTFAFYKPVRVFIGLGSIFLLIGVIPIVRFLYDYFFSHDGSGKIQSLIIGSTLISVAFNLFALGIIGDLLGRNRKLIEKILLKQKDNRQNES